MTRQRAAVAALVLGLVVAACGSPATPTNPTSATAVGASGSSLHGGGASGAAGTMVTLCHAEDGQGYRLMNVNAMAEPAHRAHGDAGVGEPVPGHPESTFGADCALAPATAALVDVRAGTVGTFNWAGQSVTTPPGGPFNNIRFNWYTFSGTPTAFGTLYVLTQEYLGLPSGLGPSTPGFVASSDSIVDNVYRFAPAVTLNGGTQYWFYTDTQGSFVTSFSESIYAGGDLYLTGVSTLPFHKAMGGPGIFLDANFTLSGAAASVP
jgi:hypothetical protein